LQKDGHWKPYNFDYMERNIARVFRTEDIKELNKYTYNFIILHMGFIAHYSLYGFQDCYQDLDEFRLNLQTSEYSRDPDYNQRWANRYKGDRDFIKWYGQAYCSSVSEGIRQIIAVAKATSQQASLPIPAWELALTKERR